MAYFEWADDMVIDNGPIDRDHQTLVRQVNELHSATCEGRGHEVVGRLLNELIRDTVEHIGREEHEMARAGYPRLAQHMEGHVQFVDDLHGLQRKYEGGQQHRGRATVGRAAGLAFTAHPTLRQGHAEIPAVPAQTPWPASDLRLSCLGACRSARRQDGHGDA